METQRLLIIEDEPKIADTLKRGLSEVGYDADVAFAFDIVHFDQTAKGT